MLKNKVLPLLVSIVVAFFLWAYVVTFVSSEQEGTFYDIPVSYQGEALLDDRNLMVTTELRPTVTLTLYGSRSELKKLDSSNITILTDLSKIGEPGVHTLSYNVFYPGNIPDNAFNVQSQYPGMVTVEVERRITVEVPIQVNYSGSVEKDYLADTENVELTNSVGTPITSVQISGPSSVVSQITQAVVEVPLDGKSESFSDTYRFTLCDATGAPVDVKMVQTNMAEVNLTLYIKRVKEIPLVVTVVEGGGATEKSTKIAIDPEMIKVAGSESALEGLDEWNLGTIHLGKLDKDTVETFEITLPAGIDNLSGKTEAKVAVTFTDLLTKNVLVTNFVAMNVPEGMEAEFITEALTVLVRGPSKLVNILFSDKITVTVDFANAQEGTYTYKANIVIAENFKSVGEIGTYSVSATLRPIVVEEVEE